MTPRKLTLIRVESLTSGKAREVVAKPEPVEALEQFLDNGATTMADKHISEMTLAQFRQKLLALLQEATQAGLDVDEVGQTAEDVIANEQWDA